MGTKLGIGAVGLVACAAALLSCGSQSGGACGKVQPCGGSVVGSWKLDEACVGPTVASASLLGFCPDSTTTATLTAAGTASFNQDGTYTRTISIGGTAHVSIPPSCLVVPALGVTLTCDQVGQLATPGLTVTPFAEVQSATCASSGSTCECTVTLNPQVMTQTGTYDATGTQLSQFSGGGTTLEQDYYCVQGGKLHLMDATLSASAGATGGATGAAMTMFDINADLVWSKS
jgi:hypothetical protein